MVERYNDIFSSSSSSSPNFTAKAIQGDLLSSSSHSTSSSSPPTQTVNGEAIQNFDTAIVGLGFHHFHNPAHALHVLKSTVKPTGGVVGIVDFLPFPAAPAQGHHHHKHADQAKSENSENDNAFPKEATPTIKTHGFSEGDMKRLFAEAGFVEFEFRRMEGEVEMFVGSEERRVVRSVFVGRGVRRE